MSIPPANTINPMDYLYRVDKYEYGQISCSGDAENAYPKYNLSHSASNIFRTWDDSMKHIQREVSEDMEYADIHHFIVKRLEWGKSPDWGDVLWLFDNKGNQLDCSHISSTYCQPEEQIRFEQGDIVEIITVNKKEQSVSLGIVVKKSPECSFDEPSFLIATAPGVKPEKVASIKLMKPRFTISNDLRDYLQKCFETVNYDKIKETENPPFPYGFALGGFGELLVCIDVYPIHATPHLHIVDKNCKFVVNLRLDKPEYFVADKTSDVLQDYQIDELMDYLTDNINGKTRWWFILRRFWEWYDDYNLNIPLDTPIPDYRKLINNNSSIT